MNWIIARILREENSKLSVDNCLGLWLNQNMKDIFVQFAPEIEFPKEILPDSPNWENSFISELVRENYAELNEIDCLPIGE